MPVVTFVEKSDDNRGRFLAASYGEAIEVLSQRFPIGASVAQKLARGERVSTESYTLQIRPLETAPPKRQQALF